jgi:hypothetical protein
MRVGRKIDVLASVEAAFAFTRVNAQKAAGVLSIILLFEIAVILTPIADRPVILVLKGFEALFGIVAQGALYRLAFANEHVGEAEFRLGPFGLQVGKPELRLVGALLLLLFLVFLILLFWVLILIVWLGAGMFVSGNGSVNLGVQPVSPTPQQASQFLLAFAPLIIPALAVYTRICLYGAATVAERKVSVFSTWPLTRGNFWPILGAVILIAIPTVALNGLATLPGEPPTVTIVLELLTCVLDVFLIRPMYCGLFAHIYTRLRTSAPVEAVGRPGRGPWG